MTRDPDPGSSWNRLFPLAALAVLAVAIWIGLGDGAAGPLNAAPAQRLVPSTPRITERLPWHDAGVWLQGDSHVHFVLTRALGPRIVARARQSRLDFIASTEHAERAFKPGFQQNLATLRRRFDDLIVLMGVEWNVPAGGHATVIVESSPREFETLRRFAAEFDRKVALDLVPLEAASDGITWGSIERAERALSWLADPAAHDGVRAVVYLNHPSRGAELGSAELARLHAAGLAGVEVGLGHQKWNPPGSPASVDRYDPFLAVVGGDHDRLLAEDRYLGLTANSDFHTAQTSYFPGEFSRTLVFCPDRTAAGVVAGLAAGSTATVMGGMVTSLEALTTTPGLDGFARIGEVLEVSPGASIRYGLRVSVAAWDFENAPNRLDEVELISDWGGSARVVERFEPLRNGRLTFDYLLPAEATARTGEFFLRARGRRRVGGDGNALGDADLLFYTGATRVRVVAGPAGVY